MCLAGGADVCERVSAWLTKAWGLRGVEGEGQGRVAAPEGPRMRLQLALARRPEDSSPLLRRLGPGVGRRPLGQGGTASPL